VNDDNLSIDLINTLEESINQPSRERLADLLSYFEFIQESLIVAFNNGGTQMLFDKTPNNPKPFVFIATTRAFSISRVAMNVTIRGYPTEGRALTRTLFELCQCTQYLARHPESINSFLIGKVKLERVLNMAKAEGVRPKEHCFGRFWGLASIYSHASPDSLALGLATSDENRITEKLVISDPKIIDDTVYGIMGALLMHYFIFRSILKNDFAVANQLRVRDKRIFDPENIRKFARLSSISDKELAEVYSFFSSED
jgi:hypothetical protein